MNIALPILLLVFGSLTFWLLTESALKWYFKTGCIFAFCIFTVIFWFTTHSFLGWPAHEDDMPDKVLIHWIIIKEPNKQINSKGAVYILLQSAEENETSPFLKFFAYKNDNEPRLYRLAYSRGLHEQLEKEVMGKLRSGQPVTGGLKKGMSPKDGKNKEKGKNGSESQEQEWHFHALRPSDFLQKPEQKR